MDFFGVSLTQTTRHKILDQCRAALMDTKVPVTVVTPNPEILLKAQKDPSFAYLLNSATLRIPDGIGLYVAAQLAESRLPKWARVLVLPWYITRLFFARSALYQKYGERFSGSDLTSAALRWASDLGLSVVIVEPLVRDILTSGDRRKKENQSKMGDILRAKFPGISRLDIVYADATNPTAIFSEISAHSYPLVISTLGAPRQEKMILEIARQCPQSRLLLAVGGSLDFECGFVRRAPKIFQSAGLEWLWRLMLEPRKRARRIWDATVKFSWEAWRASR